MKRFYTILAIMLFGFFLIPKINLSYNGFEFFAMAIATIAGEMIIPIIIWFALYFIAQTIDSVKDQPNLGIKTFIIVGLFAAFTSVGLIFPEVNQLFE